MIRFLFTNWLAEVDKPAAERSTRARRSRTSIFTISIDRCRAARDVSPEMIIRAIDETLLARWMFRGSRRTRTVNRDPPSARGKATAFLRVNGSGDRC